MKQENKCFYCYCVFGLDSYADNYPTFEHLKDKHSPEGRSDRVGDIVIACKKCNQDRNAEQMRNRPKKIVDSKKVLYAKPKTKEEKLAERLERMPPPLPLTDKDRQIIADRAEAIINSMNGCRITRGKIQ